MYRNTNSSSHDDSVPERDLRGVHASERIIQKVLACEEDFLDVLASLSLLLCLVDLNDISSCTESFLTCSSDKTNSRSSLRLVSPVLEHRQHDVDHIIVEGVQGFGRVQNKLGNVCSVVVHDHRLFGLG